MPGGSNQTTKSQDLYAQVQACTLCADLPAGPRPVFQLSPNARILIAGQAPGRRVHESGIPFDDPSGDRLRRWLGVDRATFYDTDCFAILPMGLCYPGTGKSGDLPPRPECAPQWREALLATIPQIELTLVIGQYAQAWYLKNQRAKSLRETVAKWQTFWPDFLPLPHPSPRNIRWFKQNPWLETEVIPVLQDRVQQLLPSNRG